MWKYFQSNSRNVSLERNPEAFELLNKLSQGIVDNKLVFLASLELAETFRQMFCSWAVHPNHCQILMYRDPHQRELIAFPKGNSLSHATTAKNTCKAIAKGFRNAYSVHVGLHHRKLHRT